VEIPNTKCTKICSLVLGLKQQTSCEEYVKTFNNLYNMHSPFIDNLSPTPFAGIVNIVSSMTHRHLSQIPGLTRLPAVI
jgi:hypothetical protein